MRFRSSLLEAAEVIDQILQFLVSDRERWHVILEARCNERPRVLKRLNYVVVRRHPGLHLTSLSPDMRQLRSYLASSSGQSLNRVAATAAVLNEGRASSRA